MTEDRWCCFHIDGLGHSGDCVPWRLLPSDSGKTAEHVCGYIVTAADMPGLIRECDHHHMECL